MPPPPTVVLLAAGLGTRYGGSKQLDPVGPGGTAILDYSLADAAAAGFRSAVVVVRPDLDAGVRRHLGHTGAAGLPWELAHQTPDTALPPGEARAPGRVRPWGTAHAVLSAAPHLGGPFAVANADDHYGPEAWRCLGGWLGRARAGERCEGAVVGYRVADTLSPHGGVSRAVLSTDADGHLVRMEEARDVRRAPDGGLVGTVRGAPRELDPDAQISMNLWAFTPAVLPVLEEAFHAFVASGPGPSDELHLPDVVGRAVEAGRLRIRLLPCGAAWFGMTHPEDREEVALRLAERGVPAPPAPPTD